MRCMVPVERILFQESAIEWQGEGKSAETKGDGGREIEHGEDMHVASQSARGDSGIPRRATKEAELHKTAADTRAQLPSRRHRAHHTLEGLEQIIMLQEERKPGTDERWYQNGGLLARVMVWA